MRPHGRCRHLYAVDGNRTQKTTIAYNIRGPEERTRLASARSSARVDIERILSLFTRTDHAVCRDPDVVPSFNFSPGSASDSDFGSDMHPGLGLFMDYVPEDPHINVSKTLHSDPARYTIPESMLNLNLSRNCCYQKPVGISTRSQEKRANTRSNQKASASATRTGPTFFRVDSLNRAPTKGSVDISQLDVVTFAFHLISARPVLFPFYWFYFCRRGPFYEFSLYVSKKVGVSTFPFVTSARKTRVVFIRYQLFFIKALAFAVKNFIVGAYGFRCCKLFSGFNVKPSAMPALPHSLQLGDSINNSAHSQRAR
ncbi:hypothetical protein EVAR_61019_1 [Eumeta japonica]|uniref:Uncharacterized protein n=1 Tax=Eumeta variegata TaxID=151549 RepID=A0A4C1ZDI7_EUMVA|nr:hypothetical protein EVAR_61019_1 [Eumeta japonica]